MNIYDQPAGPPTLAEYQRQTLNSIPTVIPFKDEVVTEAFTSGADDSTSQYIRDIAVANRTGFVARMRDPTWTPDKAHNQAIVDAINRTAAQQVAAETGGVPAAERGIPMWVWLGGGAIVAIAIALVLRRRS